MSCHQIQSLEGIGSWTAEVSGWNTTAIDYAGQRSSTLDLTFLDEVFMLTCRNAGQHFSTYKSLSQHVQGEAMRQRVSMLERRFGVMGMHHAKQHSRKKRRRSGRNGPSQRVCEDMSRQRGGSFVTVSTGVDEGLPAYQAY